MSVQSGFEPGTVIASAVISTVISTAVAFVVASATAGRQERGKRRSEARRAVREAVADFLRAAREAELGLDPALEGKNDALVTDYLFASRVLVAAEPLGFTRRWLIRLRLRRVAGRIAVDLATDVPVVDRGAAHQPMVAKIIAGGKAGKYDFERLGGLRRDVFITDGAKADRDLIVKLRKQLSRLAACR